MIKTIIDRTSCRSYLSKPIELEKINQLKSVINSSPTARNIQDFSCVFVTDKTALEKLAIYADNQKHVAEAPLFIAFYADNNRPNAKNNWMYADAIIACTLAMVTAEQMGLQSCLIGRVVHHKTEVNALLNVKGDAELIIGLSIGYAQKKTPPHPKLNRCYDNAYDIEKVKLGK